MPQLSAVACSILDARSPDQFVFMPDWMMKALRLRPRFVCGPSPLFTFSVSLRERRLQNGISIS